MTFLDLYTTELDKALGSEQTTLFTVPKRKYEINQAMLWFVTETACCQKRGEIEMVDEQAEYDLLTELDDDSFLFWTPTDVEVWALNTNVSPNKTTYFAGPEFPRMTENLLNQQDPGWRETTPGDPLSWYDRNDGGQFIVGINPPPKIESGWEWTLVTPYTIKADDMSADADVPFTVGAHTYTNLTPWHIVLAQKAASELEKLRKGLERSQFFLQQAQQGVLDYRDKTRVPESRRATFQGGGNWRNRQWGGYDGGRWPYQGYPFGRVLGGTN